MKTEKLEIDIYKKSEGVHYELIPLEEDSQAWAIRIIEGPFSETVIKYGRTEFDGTGDDTIMKFLSDGVVMAGKVAVADFICPTKAARESFNADYTVWMDTIKFGKYEDTNLMYERLESNEYNYHVSRWFEKAEEQLAEVVTTYMKRKIEGNTDDI